MHRRLLAALAAAALTLPLAASSAGAVTLRDTFEATYDLGPGGKLVLANVNGDITVEAWDRPQVEVVADKRVRSRSRSHAEEAMDRFQIEVDRRGDTLVVQTERPRESRSFWSWLFGRHVEAQVEYRVRVPSSSFALDLETVNGNLTVDRVRGRIDAGTVNGRVWIAARGGTVEASTINGSMEVELADFDPESELSLRTTNGSITARLPGNTRADLDASTTNGRIRVDLPVTVDGRLSRKRLRGAVNGGGGRVNLRTINGSISIRSTGA